ncbi:hypothetical protein AR158_c199R [Paramecium bursaria Chlorella virus AR158]|uniref:hypothetical protein n=1 Tax=Paramecium bursaria Chlorella virus AR158 TaxID=380598 RepID=UPI00015AA855|nr:hypothetical protein AR158_c199R [Paramecium bursaria Chlorella virus AR158]ABU43745.1 hypothetical protein AR158_c199R [Paramecium bursaria Chlorella virus AR158]
MSVSASGSSSITFFSIFFSSSNFKSFIFLVTFDVYDSTSVFASIIISFDVKFGGGFEEYFFTNVTSSKISSKSFLEISGS